MLGTAQRLYRLAKEREKPDAERDSGYQERDMTFFRQGLERLDRRYDEDVDKAEWMMFLKAYIEGPEEYRVEALDAALDLPEEWDAEQVSEVRSTACR
jgi:hypothetical protein